MPFGEVSGENKENVTGHWRRLVLPVKYQRVWQECVLVFCECGIECLA